jgi:multiple sugar transport system permease protein
MGYASAQAWIQLLLVLILTAIAFWSSKKWVHYQGK